MRTAISLPGLIVVVAIAAVAQSSENAWTDLRRTSAQRGVAVRGQISSESVIVGSLTVELVSNGHSVSASTLAAGDGSFEFSSVAPGAYDLRITGGGGAIVHQQSIFISGPESNLSVNIPGRPSADQHGGGTISIRQLQHKIPADAQKEFSKGITASKKGDHQSAVEHFQKAVSIDPELVEGYNNLGAAHAALGQLEQAAEQFQKAIEQVPEYTLALANLSLALCSTERYPEAEQAARRALKLDSSLSKVRYVLAVSLIAQHRDPTELVAPEVLDNLERATPEVPKARLVAADILAQAGRRDDAARQLEEYLRSTPEQDTDRQRVEAWLTHLRVQ